MVPCGSGWSHVHVCVCVQAEDELRKAQQVFEELNGSLQNELPTLWDR